MKLILIIIIFWSILLLYFFAIWKFALIANSGRTAMVQECDNTDGAFFFYFLQVNFTELNPEGRLAPISIPYAIIKKAHQWKKKKNQATHFIGKVLHLTQEISNTKVKE